MVGLNHKKFSGRFFFLFFVCFFVIEIKSFETFISLCKLVISFPTFLFNFVFNPLLAEYPLAFADIN